MVLILPQMVIAAVVLLSGLIALAEAVEEENTETLGLFKAVTVVLLLVVTLTLQVVTGITV